MYDTLDGAVAGGDVYVSVSCAAPADMYGVASMSGVSFRAAGRCYGWLTVFSFSDLAPCALVTASVPPATAAGPGTRHFRFRPQEDAVGVAFSLLMQAGAPTENISAAPCLPHPSLLPPFCH